MKIPYQSKKILDLENSLKAKDLKYDIVSKCLLKAILGKQDDKTVHDLTSLRNNLLVDISMIEKQIHNINYKGKQYGHELKEWNVRKYID
jgi:hypothetical protein